MRPSGMGSPGRLVTKDGVAKYEPLLLDEEEDGARKSFGVKNFPHDGKPWVRTRGLHAGGEAGAGGSEGTGEGSACSITCIFGRRRNHLTLG